MDTLRILNPENAFPIQYLPARITQVGGRIASTIVLLLCFLVIQIRCIWRNKFILELITALSYYFVCFCHVFIAPLPINPDSSFLLIGLSKTVVASFLMYYVMQARFRYVKWLWLNNFSFVASSLVYYGENTALVVICCIVKGIIEAVLVAHVYIMEQGVRERYVVVREMEIVQRTVEEENRKSSEVLIRLLPRTVIPRVLSSMNGAKFSSFIQYEENVTLFFSDFNEFNFLLDIVDPKTVVRLLNMNLEYFENVHERYGLQRVKTVQDACFCFYKSPKRGVFPNGLLAAFHILAAIKARKLSLAVDKTRISLDVRIGIAHGNVHYTFLGEQLVSFELFGPPVEEVINLAVSSEVNRINCAQNVMGLFYDSFVFKKNAPGMYYAVGLRSKKQRNKQGLTRKNSFSAQLLGLACRETPTLTIGGSESDSDCLKESGDDEIDKPGEWGYEMPFLTKLSLLFSNKRDNEHYHRLLSKASTGCQQVLNICVTSFCQICVILSFVFFPDGHVNFSPYFFVIIVITGMSTFVAAVYLLSLMNSARKGHHRGSSSNVWSAYVFAYAYFLCSIVFLVSSVCLLAWYEFNCCAFTSIVVLIPFFLCSTPLIHYFTLIPYFVLHAVLNIVLFAISSMSTVEFNSSLVTLCSVFLISIMVRYRKDYQTLSRFYAIDILRKKWRLLNAIKVKNNKLQKSFLPMKFLEEGVFFSTSILSVVVHTNLYGNRVLERVKLLNTLFCVFDEIILAHNLVKVKSFRNSYLSISSNEECNTAILMTSKMIIREFNDVLSTLDDSSLQEYAHITVGLHRGKLYSGIVGKKKTQWDVFGESVRYAFEMVYSAEKGRIQCSEEYAKGCNPNSLEERKDKPRLLDLSGTNRKKKKRKSYYVVM